jgi:hypothetical protein
MTRNPILELWGVYRMAITKIEWRLTIVGGGREA